MARFWNHQYIPHSLLITGAAIGLSLVTSGPRDVYTPAQFTQADVQAQPVLDHYRPYMDAQGNTRSIAEIMQQVRARMDRIKQAQAEKSEEALNTQTPLSSLMTDSLQRRMVRHQDVQPIPKANTSAGAPTIHYVDVVGSLDLQTPDAIEEREYTVLGYGEIDQDQSNASPSDIRTVMPTAPSNDVAGGFTSNTPFLTATPPTADAVTAPQPSAPIVAQTEAASPTVAMNTATISTTEPLASLAAAPTTRSASEQVAALGSPKTMTPTDARPQTFDLPTQSVFNLKAQSTNNAPSTTHMDMTAKTDSDGLEKSLAKINQLRDNNSPSTTPANNTTPNMKTRQAFPSAPKEPGPAKSDQDAHDDHPSVSPTKTTGKTNNPLLVYIDKHNNIGSDRVNAIDNALSRINQVVKKADLDVEFKVTTDKNSGYNILFAEDDGNNMGNKLGLAEFAVTEDDQGNEFFLGENQGNQGGKAKVSINNAFKWFSGDDADDIDEDEYDYQTAVEHEFLHLLGLDDDFDNLDSVTHGLLSPGEVRREIHDREVDTLSDIFAYANPWRSAYNPASWSSSFNSNRWGNTRYKAKALTAALVPEPASLGLIALGLLGIARRP